MTDLRRKLQQAKTRKVIHGFTLQPSGAAVIYAMTGGKYITQSGRDTEYVLAVLRATGS